MKLNLDPARKVLEDLMTDECKITRDSEGETDDTWDDDTGTYQPAPDDRATVYEGPFSYGSTRSQEQRPMGVSETIVTGYAASLPKGSAPVKPRDRLKITAVDPVNGDPTAVDLEFIVDEIVHSTYSTSQRFLMHLITEKPVNA